MLGASTTSSLPVQAQFILKVHFIVVRHECEGGSATTFEIRSLLYALLGVQGRLWQSSLTAELNNNAKLRIG